MSYKQKGFERKNKMNTEIEKQITQYNAEILNKLFGDKNFIFINQPPNKTKCEMKEGWQYLQCTCAKCMEQDREHDYWLERLEILEEQRQSREGED